MPPSGSITSVNPTTPRNSLRKRLTEYEKVRTVNKTHKSAAESLYAISTCAQLLSEAAEKSGDEDAKQRWYDRLFAGERSSRR